MTPGACTARQGFSGPGACLQTLPKALGSASFRSGEGMVGEADAATWPDGPGTVAAWIAGAGVEGIGGADVEATSGPRRYTFVCSPVHNTFGAL